MTSLLAKSRDVSEGHPGQKIHQLREQGLAGIQGESSGKCFQEVSSEVFHIQVDTVYFI
jgi:hypothetical protein